ncbi:Toxin HigB-2 [Thauera mechernichensis]|nr:toxin HigB-2 [Thauera sp.]
MVFVELPIFSRCAQALFSDAQLRELQQVLLENPSVGDLIPGGRGLRKFRVALLGRGKRGGARVIYYHWVSREQCYLIYAYAKNARADLTKDQLRRLAEVIETEVSNG